MTIKEFNLLNIIVYDGNNIIYEGMCENAPEEIKPKQIQIDEIHGKTIKIKLV